jgi:regulatory protein
MVLRKYKILSISLKKKNRYVITLSNNITFEVSEHVLIEKSLYLNKEIYKADLDKILLSESFSDIRESALVFLSYRMRSKKELYQKLVKKGYKNDMVLETISEFENKGWLDDEKFGLAYSREQINRNSLGPIALKYKLKQFLDSEELIQQISSAIYSEIEIEEIIQKVLIRYKASVIADDERLKRKLINKLKRKGHYWQDIDSVLNNYLSPPNLN